MTSTAYCEKIEGIFDAMICLADEVLPENREGVDSYISAVWSQVAVFVQSITREGGTEDLKSKFQSYVDAEEARLRKNFEDIKYDIESYDMVQLVAGVGRTEMVIVIICSSVSGTILNCTHLDLFPDVVSFPEERLGKNQSRPKIRPFCLRNGRRKRNDLVDHRCRAVQNRSFEG